MAGSQAVTRVALVVLIVLAFALDSHAGAPSFVVDQTCSDEIDSLLGHKLYIRDLTDPSGDWTHFVTLPCAPEMEDTDGDGRGDTERRDRMWCWMWDADAPWACRNVVGGLPYPPWRVDASIPRLAEFCATAYNGAGESACGNALGMEHVGFWYWWREIALFYDAQGIRSVIGQDAALWKE